LRKNLVADLICLEQIVTTEAKARIEVHARRLASARLPKTRIIEDDSGYFEEVQVVQKLFEDIAPRYADRPGGYTRMVKIGKRPGDNAEMAVLMLVDEE
jgi:large subunit ribosomal protein L17